MLMSRGWERVTARKHSPSNSVGRPIARSPLVKEAANFVFTAFFFTKLGFEHAEFFSMDHVTFGAGVNLGDGKQTDYSQYLDDGLFMDGLDGGAGGDDDGEQGGGRGKRRAPIGQWKTPPHTMFPSTSDKMKKSQSMGNLADMDGEQNGGLQIAGANVPTLPNPSPSPCERAPCPRHA